MLFSQSHPRKFILLDALLLLLSSHLHHILNILFDMNLSVTNIYGKIQICILIFKILAFPDLDNLFYFAVY